MAREAHGSAWTCERCRETFTDDEPAFGWTDEPYCEPCFEKTGAMIEGEPSLQAVAKCEGLLERDGR